MARQEEEMARQEEEMARQEAIATVVPSILALLLLLRSIVPAQFVLLALGEMANLAFLVILALTKQVEERRVVLLAPRVVTRHHLVEQCAPYAQLASSRQEVLHRAVLVRQAHIRPVEALRVFGMHMRLLYDRQEHTAPLLNLDT